MLLDLGGGGCTQGMNPLPGLEKLTITDRGLEKPPGMGQSGGSCPCLGQKFLALQLGGDEGMRGVNVISFPKHSVDMQDGDTTSSLDETCFRVADPDLPAFSWLGMRGHLQHVAMGNVQVLDGKGLVFSLHAVKMGNKGRTELQHLGRTSRSLPAGRLDPDADAEHL